MDIQGVENITLAVLEEVYSCDKMKYKDAQTTKLVRVSKKLFN